MGIPTTGTPMEGVLSKMWFAAALPFDATTALCIEFQGEGLQSVREQYHPDVIRGQRSRPRELRREARVNVSGTITFPVTKTALISLMPHILGTAASGSGTAGSPYVFVIGQTLPEFQLLIQKVLGSLGAHTAEIFLYEGCYVSTAVFSAGQNGPLMLTLGIEAKRETPFADGALNVAGTINTGANVCSTAGVPTSDPSTDPCFMFWETQGASSSFELGGVEREAFDWSLSINNLLDTGRFMNSLYRSRIPTQGLDITMASNVGFTASEDDLYNPGINASSPDMNDNVILFYLERGTNDDALKFEIASWQPVATTPVVGGKGEVILPLSGPVDAKFTATAKKELQVSIWTT